MGKNQHNTSKLKEDSIPPVDAQQPFLDPKVPKPLALNPHYSLFNDLIAVTRGMTLSAEFSLGIVMDVTTGTTAIADSTLQAYANYQFIKEAEKNYEDTLKQLDWIKLREFRKQRNKEKSEADLNGECSREELKDYCAQILRDKITTDTVKPAAIATTSLAATIFSLGLLFPPIFPITSIITIACVGAGLLFTSLATFINRRVLNKKIDQVLKQENLQDQMDEKLISLKKTHAQQDEALHQKAAHERKRDKQFSQASDALLGSTLIFRIGVLGRYALNLLGTIAGSLLAVAQYFRGAVDAVINYRNRQKYLSNLPKLIGEATLPVIDSRPYIFFGETPLEKYIRIHKKQLFKKHHLPAEYQNLSARDLVTSLNNEQGRAQLLEMRKAATTDLLEKDLRKMCKELKLKYDPNNQEVIEAYLHKRVHDHLRSDILTSGRLNSIKIALGTWVTGSLLFPPLAPIFCAVNIGIMLIGEFVSRLVCRSELKKFKEATDPLIKQAFQGNPNNDPAVSQISLFIGSIKTELTKLHAPHRSTKKILTTMPEASLPSSSPTFGRQVKLSPKIMESSIKDSSLFKESAALMIPENTSHHHRAPSRKKH